MRCLYTSGCLWQCAKTCGDGRQQFTVEQRQKMLRDRVKQEQDEGQRAIERLEKTGWRPPQW